MFRELLNWFLKFWKSECLFNWGISFLCWQVFDWGLRNSTISSVDNVSMIQLYGRDGWLLLEDGSYRVVLDKLLEEQEQLEVNSLPHLCLCSAWILYHRCTYSLNPEHVKLQHWSTETYYIGIDRAPNNWIVWSSSIILCDLEMPPLAYELCKHREVLSII